MAKRAGGGEGEVVLTDQEIHRVLDELEKLRPSTREELNRLRVVTAYLWTQIRRGGRVHEEHIWSVGNAGVGPGKR
jgi:hypothetical protein